MKYTLRSKTTTEGRKMAGARSLWRAVGMKENQFGKPIIGIVNSFTQFVPGHVHLHTIGQEVKKIIEDLGCFAAEFNTIAIDDGIAMGHDGMLYSLPSRDLIADSVEYMANAHTVDALFCIANCDKIVPGMLMAAFRINVPMIYVSGGPMEAGIVNDKKYDLIDAIVAGSDDEVSDKDLAAIEANACPSCGSCSGMFTANSMNCLAEALGLALPGNGTLVATHKNRKKLFIEAARILVKNTRRYYEEGDESVLPRSIATKQSFRNAMALDIAMGGSTNTVLHILALAREAGVDFTMKDIDEISRKVPCLSKVAPSSPYHVEDVHRAGGILGIMAELDRGGLLDTSVKRVDAPSLKDILAKYDVMNPNPSREALELYHSAPSHKGRNLELASQDSRFKELDLDRKTGCIRSIPNAYYPDGGLAVLYGNLAQKGCIVKTAGVDPSLFHFEGPARVFESQEEACDAILGNQIKPGDVIVIRYEGPKGGPGMQEMLYPTSFLKSRHLGKECALITDGRFSGGTSGLSIGHVSPEAASGGEIALVREGDPILIDIPSRKIELQVDEKTLQKRQKEEEARGKKAYRPHTRDRKISAALRAYAHFAASADVGAVRVIPETE